MKRVLSATVGAAILLAAAAPASAALVNGGFEDPGAVPVTVAGSGALGTAAVGWTINNNYFGTTSTEELASTDPFAPGGGANMMHIVTNVGASGLFQITAGYGNLSADFYVVSGTAWLLSALDGATVGGGVGQVATTALGQWQHLTVNFAGANEAVLYSFGLTGADFYVDNVVVSDFVIGDPTTSIVTASGGVPEPTAWAMMILGLGMAGGMIRARRRLTLA